MINAAVLSDKAIDMLLVLFDKYEVEYFSTDNVDFSDPESEKAFEKLLLEGFITGIICDDYSISREAAREARKEQLRREEQAKREREQQEILNAQIQADRTDADKKTKKQFRHDWRIAVFNTFISFALGAVFDHFVDIVSHASDLWRSLFH